VPRSDTFSGSRPAGFCLRLGRGPAGTYSRSCEPGCDPGLPCGGWCTDLCASLAVRRALEGQRYTEVRDPQSDRNPTENQP
jgi:hypothetical protein